MAHEQLDDILKHFGVKGMHWGVRRETKGRHRSEKLKRHPSVIAHGKQSIRKGRQLRAKLDVDHIDIKTGNYTNQSKTAKTLRTIDRVMDLASVTLVSSVSVLNTIS